MDLLYEQLDVAIGQIRLLYVLPLVEAGHLFAHGDTTQCLLTTVRAVEAESQYDALSYTWGNPTVTRTIIVNGYELKVTENLARFLREWRQRSMDNDARGFVNRPLWVDAVCINQNNEEEKSVQVQQMGRIYRSAARTLSWLGESTPFSSIAMGALDEMAREIVSNREGTDPTGWMNDEQSHLWSNDCQATTCKMHENLLFTTTNHVWNCIMEFFDLTYWGRAWIFQELCLAREISLWCGHKALQLSSLLEVLDWRRCVQGHPFPSFVSEKLGQILHLGGFINETYLENFMRIKKETNSKDKEAPGNLQDWISYVIVIKHLEATDPRDKVYSVLGITNCDARPNYSISVESVFAEFARISARSSCNLSLLDFSGLGIMPVREEGRFSMDVHHLFLPSWVPNWDTLRAIGSVGLLRSEDWRADAGLRDTIPFGFVGENGLHARGIALDIVATSQSLASDDLLEFCRNYLHGSSEPHSRGKELVRFLYLDTGLTSQLKYHQIEDKSEFYIDAFGSISSVLGRIGNIPEREIFHMLGFHSSGDMFQRFFGWGQHEWCTKIQKSTERRFHTWGRDFEVDLAIQIFKLMLAYNVFTLREGRIGWGPPRMQVGDIVCIVSGYALPVALRKLDGSTYRYVGPCFVIGIMGGEATEGVAVDPARIEDFNLK